MDDKTANLASPWEFRDGQEYHITLSINHSQPKTVSITLADKITAEEWSGQFDDKWNYKPFDTFVSMVKCAILKKSDAVTLDNDSQIGLKNGL